VFVELLRKPLYNLTITAASVLVALLIGGVDAVGCWATSLRYLARSGMRSAA